MSDYSYTPGEGLAKLDPTTPVGASEPISILDDAIRQIKAYMRDSTGGLAALKTTVDNLVVAVGSAGNRNFFSAYSSVNQSIPVTTETKINFGLELTDPDGVFNNSTSRFTAPATGWYQMVFSVRTDWLTPSTPTGIQLNLRLKKNGSTNELAGEFDLDTNTSGATYSLIRSLPMNAGDYLEAYVAYTLGSGSVSLQITADNTKTALQGIRML